DSIDQYTKAGRSDLADQESAEIAIIEQYLPAQLSAEEVAGIIDEVIAATGAAGPQDMGKVMGQLKGKLQGRADMGAASALVRQKLAG
ncbi:MAG: GatB/YqeY domain-containing protein, partial [Chromatiales bacterium]